MTASSILNIHDMVIDHDPPRLPDRCSVQAVTEDSAGPILTIYRQQHSTAVDWITYSGTCGE